MMHSISNCPLRTMALIKVNHEDIITFASQEMTDLFHGQSLVNQNIFDIWTLSSTEQQQEQVVTLKDKRTLCICTHQEQAMRIILCSDISQLSQIYHYQQPMEGLIISRLTMYGTIDGLFQPGQDSLSIGQPIMRYIHPDDVQTFCAGLSQATKYNQLVHFQVRLTIQDPPPWSAFTVMAIEDGKILCLIRPDSDQDNAVIQTHSYYLERVTHIQQKFWYALEHGMTLIAQHLATSLMVVIQTLWCLWHYDTKSLILLSEHMLRKAVDAAKERPEINRVCRMMSWVGISPTTSKSFIDNTLDHTTEWFVSKACTKYYYDMLV
ncbi:uncharacterized protein B0P05DRAFT_554733 [Gilbertella persicaria]|uniref:uncharacterized protein n=1 Tax=Gilbertella persicaria TaxID=101096 RepID=UPI002220B348|nr:uncharacterized protein B0P05DRAFT_554733 [Gilbertella persicaria]KAI8064254.1 hypothetical protein B0P05DRAFT_554733 [Gilbertella persicaria]